MTLGVGAHFWSTQFRQFSTRNARPVSVAGPEVVGLEQSTMARIRIGLDFGGVIVPAASDKSKEDTALRHGALLLDDPLPGAVEGVAALVQASGGNVWIVSKAGLRTQARTRHWLDATRFFPERGLKSPICISVIHAKARRPFAGTSQ